MPKSVLIVLSVVIIIFISKWLYRKNRRRKIKKQDFPKEWENIILKNIPIYKFIPNDLKEELCGHVLVFLDEKKFEGCKGIQITDEIRITIAAQACVLLLNRKPNYYPKCDTVLVYPTAYIVKNVTVMGPLHVEGKSVVLGESWSKGLVVLAWDQVKQTAHDYKDGNNLVFHEFAHQLDVENGASDGTPLLNRNSCYITWARVLGKAYRKLEKKAKSGRKSVMNSYGATNAAEFFAVASETFFEKPKQMKKKHPKLYEELRIYYNLDPIKWFENY